jgi:N-6 DNA Methylase
MEKISLYWLTGDLVVRTDPEQPDLDNLRFPAKVRWARALAGPQDKDGIWSIALKLNELRNSVAHRTRKGGGRPTRPDFSITADTSNKQLAFIEHIVRALKPQGRAAVVMEFRDS